MSLVVCLKKRYNIGMHYLPLIMHSNNPKDSISSPFYYAFDGRNLAVCFCTDKDFAYSQIEISRSQHFPEDYVGEWGLGVLEFGSIEQLMFFIQKWNVLVQTKLGMQSPAAVALWSENEPHRFITFEDIVKHSVDKGEEKEDERE